MKERRIYCTLGGYYSDLSVEIKMTDDVKIPDEAINKVLPIAMNYLLENVEMDKQEEPE